MQLTIAEDARSVVSRGELSKDGRTWEPDQCGSLAGREIGTVHRVSTCLLQRRHGRISVLSIRSA
jgi:hypothetical protein